MEEPRYSEDGCFFEHAGLVTHVTVNVFRSTVTPLQANNVNGAPLRKIEAILTEGKEESLLSGSHVTLFADNQDNNASYIRLFC